MTISADSETQAAPRLDSFIREQLAEAARLWLTRGGTRLQFEIANRTVELRCISGPPSKDFFMVLEHAKRMEPLHVPQSVVYLLDAAASRTAPPPSTWIFPDETLQDSQRVCWRPEAGLALVSDDSRGIWHLFDLHTKTGLYWLRSASELPAWEYGSPLRHFVHWTALAGGQGMVHAAAIARNGVGVLLAGRGGSGKSTMTAAAIASGWETVGDDFVIVEASDGPVAYPIFDIMKLTGMAEGLYRDAVNRAVNPARAPDEKALIPITALAGDRFVPRVPIKALLAMRLSGAQNSAITPCTRVDALAALAPSTMNILRTAMPETLAFCGALMRQVPAYTLNVGTDPNEGLRVLDAFLEELR
ncbi:MAG: hypothetical protein U1E46_00350 [Hyphomicrobiales bacterium]